MTDILKKHHNNLIPSKIQKIINTLALHGEITVGKLVNESGVRRNDVFELIPIIESKNLITTRYEGRVRLVSLTASILKEKQFIKNYSKRLKYYKKSLEKELKALEKNLPLVSDKLPLIKVKTREYVFSLDKKTNTRKDMGKTREGHGYTFNARPSAEKQFIKILDLLYKLYQESSSLN